jgi:glycosyltransferase involved in cell wall biosynthesis
MKVIHFIWSLNFGGIARMVINLALQQKQRTDLYPSILIGTRKGKYLSLFEQSVVPLHFANLDTGWNLSPLKFYKIYRIMKQYDIIHLHTFNPLVALAARWASGKIVFTVHGNFGLGRKRQMKDRLLHFLCGKFICHWTHYLIYNSEFSKRYAQHFYHLDGRRAEKIIYNALPENKTSMADEQTDFHQHIPHNSFVIGTASRFAGIKRIDRLIEAFSLFSHDKPDVRLVLVGDGILMKTLKQQVQELKIQPKVYFAGYSQQVESWLKQMDICVFPSENESFGIAALEALAMGKPVIVFADGGGLTEIIGPLNKKNIVQNVPELIQRMNDYYQNKNLALDEAEKNRLYVKRFNLADHEAAYFAVYQSLYGKE